MYTVRQHLHYENFTPFYNVILDNINHSVPLIIFNFNENTRFQLASNWHKIKTSNQVEKVKNFWQNIDVFANDNYIVKRYCEI